MAQGFIWLCCLCDIYSSRLGICVRKGELSSPFSFL